MLHVDFETFSPVPLRTRGAYQYHMHPDTRTLCMGYAFGKGDVRLWTPAEPFPKDVAEYVGDGGMIAAHNAAFERLHFWYVICPDYRIPEPRIEQFYCTAANARARALPGNLDDLARCLRLPYQKDRRGEDLIKLLCMPNDKNGDPELLQQLYDYCARDVEVERAAMAVVPELTSWELEVYHAAEYVNDAGLFVDVEFAKAAMDYADAEADEINARIAELTEGRITSTSQYQRIKDLILEVGGIAAGKVMARVTTDRRTGEEQRKLSFDGDTRTRFLEQMDDDPERYPEIVRSLVELCDEAGRSSVAKFRNMYNRADDETHRVYGAYVPFGAGQTGRFSSTGVQVHNMPRKSADAPETVRRWVLEDRELPDGVMTTLSSMLRPAILAGPGNVLVCRDWSAIEARVLPWLSDSPGGRRVLDVFATVDADPDAPDIYMLEAANLFHIDPHDVTPEQRAVGKVMVLSLGYGGGKRAFQNMARNYGIKVTEDEAEDIKVKWRRNNAWASKFWNSLETAVVQAVLRPGEIHSAGRVSYLSNNGWLFCLLPSGRILTYPQVKADYGDYGNMTVTAVKGQWKPKRDEIEWPRIQLYGGLLAENVTQAASADLLHSAIVRAVQEDLPLVGHTHDELLFETGRRDAEQLADYVRTLMNTPPHWAVGLPIASEGWIGERYRK